MTYVDAAISVLKSSRKPMSSGAIAEAAIRKGLIRPRGKTPAATMSAALYLYARDEEVPVLRRDFRPGPTRAARDSVRWVYAG